MAVGTNENVKYQAAGNGSNTTFATLLVAGGASEIGVWITTAAGAVTAQVAGVDYTFSNLGGTATIVFQTAPPAGSTVTFLRKTAIAQALDLTYNERLPSIQIEAQLDALVRMIRDLDARATIAFPGAEPAGNPTTLSAPAQRKGKLLAFNNNTGAMEELPKEELLSEVLGDAQADLEAAVSAAGNSASAASASAGSASASAGAASNSASAASASAGAASNSASAASASASAAAASAVLADVTNTSVNAAIATDPAASRTAMGVTPAATSPWISVTNAVGNGVADDSAVIQAALDAAAASSYQKTVYLPAGTYKCNLVIPEYVSLIGAGSASHFYTAKTILKPNNDSLAVIRIKFARAQSIRHLQVTGNGSSVSALGISIADDVPGTYTGESITIEKVGIKGFTKGFYDELSVGTRLIQVYVFECQYGYYLYETDTILLQNCGGFYNTVATIYGERTRQTMILQGEWRKDGNSPIGNASTRFIKFLFGQFMLKNCNCEGWGNVDALIETASTMYNIEGLLLTNDSTPSALVRETTTLQYGRSISGINATQMPNSSIAGVPIVWEGVGSVAPPEVTNVGLLYSPTGFRWAETSDFTTYIRHDLSTRQTFNPIKETLMVDDFIFGGLTTGTIGHLGWALTNLTGTSTAAHPTESASVPGQIRIYTGASSGDGFFLRPSAQVSIGGSNENLNYRINPSELRFRFRPIDTTDVVYWLGWQAGHAAGNPANFIGIRYIAGTDTNWQYVAIKAGVESQIVDSGLVFSTSLSINFSILSLKDGEALLSMNQLPQVLLSTLPPVVGLSPGISMTTSSAAAKSIMLDHAMIRIRGNRF
jgi:hypothetical protein